MDSLDPMQEIDRNAGCAGNLYSLLQSTELPLKTEADVGRWDNAMHDIISEYNVSVLLTPLNLAQQRLKMCLGNQEQQIAILESFNEQIREIMDRRKLDITAMYFSSQGTINNPPFKIERDETGDKIFIDGCPIIYDKEKNGNKNNRQWLPLMVAFISSNRHQLLETSMAEVAHTTCGDALDKCVSKTNKILRQNYQNYKDQGKIIHRVSIVKERNAPTRRLRIEE